MSQLLCMKTSIYLFMHRLICSTEKFSGRINHLENIGKFYAYDEVLQMRRDFRRFDHSFLEFDCIGLPFDKADCF